MIADMLSNNISFVFVTQSYLFLFHYFAVPNYIWLTSMHYFIMKVPNKREYQQIAFNHSSNIEFQDFMKLHKKCSAKPYFFQLLILLLHQTIIYHSKIIF